MRSANCCGRAASGSRPPTSGCRRARGGGRSGLRREEVAQLANVSVTYYTFLEQGRQARPSEQVLDALAAALRMTRRRAEVPADPRLRFR